MYCPEGMKLNKFRKVTVPTARQLFNRFGERNPLAKYSGSPDNRPETVQVNFDKVADLQSVLDSIPTEDA